MAYANSHILIRFLGHFGGAGTYDENWSVGWRFAIIGADPPLTPSALQTFVDACATAAQTYHGTGAVGAGGNCYLDTVTGARIGTDGKYNPLTQDTTRKDFTSVPGGGTPVAPWNTAGVISLRTNRPRGYASNGRVYYPMTAITPSTSTGRMTSAAVASKIAATVTLINSMNAAAAAYSTNMKLAVCSSVGSGLTALVTSIRADQRFDSIERREAKPPAIWSVGTIA